MFISNEEEPTYVPPPVTEIEFWRKTGESWISSSLSTLDERAKWMVTLAGGITVADSTLLRALNAISAVNVTPGLLFSLSVLFFVVALFPRVQGISHYQTKKMRNEYAIILESKLKWHKMGFASFFIGMLLVIVSTLFG